MASLPRAAAANGDSDQVLVEANGSTRTLILNRPRQLNALSSAMIMGLLRGKEEHFVLEVSLLTGIVMGGGAGVSIHGRFRVATENTIREGRLRTVGECLHREYRMVCHVMRGDFSRDFFEGCRAILLDKDRNPKWMPPSLEQVHDEVVEKYLPRLMIRSGKI